MNDYEKQFKKYYISKFRVKIKSLAEEARIIRAEEKLNTGWVRIGLRQHRIGLVREEQRHTLLAYAYLKGMQYANVERSCLSAPNANRIVAILKSLTRSADSNAVSQWLETLPAKKAA